MEEGKERSRKGRKEKRREGGKRKGKEFKSDISTEHLEGEQGALRHGQLFFNFFPFTLHPSSTSALALLTSRAFWPRRHAHCSLTSVLPAAQSLRLRTRSAPPRAFGAGSRAGRFAAGKRKRKLGDGPSRE